MSRIPFGIAIDGEGAHPAAWHQADRGPADLLTPSRIADRFRVLDDSAVAFALIPAANTAIVGALDAVETANFAAAVTSRLSLVAEVNTIRAEPFHLANQVNTLDWAAQGRAGWLAALDDSVDAAAAYGAAPHADASEATREAADVVAAVRLLWDTWEDDIFLADEATGRFLDLDRWHYADFEGTSFSIKGPGLLPRPPQGQLPVWGRGPVGEPFARQVDIVLVSGGTVADIDAQVRAAASVGIARAVAEVEVVLDARGVEASDRLAALDAATSGGTTGPVRLTGPAHRVAEQLGELADHVDGIVLRPAVLDVDVPVIIEEVLPALERDSVLLPDAATQRDLFRLERPANAFARPGNAIKETP
ncbi:LLM class flavin-dependent oxidoreductase [Microbacterium sp.]|uniref:LLM class flavin-dependent oxidoreductase n=1 Tax=Microbacterium sp. TaxID=51671 RepID=UPI003C74A8CC